MIHKFNRDILLMIIKFLADDIKFMKYIDGELIKRKLISLDLFFFKKTNKYIYNVIDEYYQKYKLIKKIYINQIYTIYINGVYNTNILEWFKASKFGSGIDTEVAIDNATANRYIHILEWYKTSGLEFKYTTSTITCATHEGYTDVLEWFENSGFECVCTEDNINDASTN